MRYLTIGIIFLFHSCTTQQKDAPAPGTPGSETQVITRTDTVYVVRNMGISPANSYSDLFIDSSTIDQYIRSQNISGDEEKGFRSFYNYRNGQYAWFTSQGFTEQARGFWNLQDELGTKADKTLRNKMDTLLNMDTLVSSRYDTSLLKTELALTKAYLDFYKTNRDKTQFANISPEKSIPVQKQATLVYADDILQQHADTSANKFSPQYNQLRQKLQLYTTIAKEGGWQVIPPVKQVKKGTSSPAIALVKKRLQRTGELAAGDTSAKYTDTLAIAIRQYQQRNGMKPTGFITDSLIRSLNIPVEKRIQQIIINLTRVQWMPVFQAANYIHVNIPDFLLTVFENNSKAFDIKVAVGKEGTNTTMFSGDLNQVVFSPHWNIPPSIVQREILPAMKADPNYLRNKRMEIVGKNDSLPTIRQLPGKDNALGRVKFLFPNRYDIYLHDTYAKDIFNKAKRAISHGCIRLEDAERLATYLLGNNSAWTPEKIRTAMNSGKEQFVKVQPAMPVLLTYYTAWVDETGNLNFRDDVYRNDMKAGQMLFENTVQFTSPSARDTLKKKDTVRKK